MEGRFMLAPHFTGWPRFGKFLKSPIDYKIEDCVNWLLLICFYMDMVPALRGIASKIKLKVKVLRMSNPLAIAKKKIRSAPSSRRRGSLERIRAIAGRKPSLLRRLAAAKEGNFAIISALLVVPLCLAGGGAVDWSLIMSQRNWLQGIADSAALAGAKIYHQKGKDDVRKEIEAFVNGQGGANIAIRPEINLDGPVQVKLNITHKTAFLALANMPTVEIAVFAEAAAPKPLKPTSMTFTPGKASGDWYKLVEVLVTRKGKQEVAATVEYTPEKIISNKIWITPKTNPEGEIALGDYDKLALRMNVKKDGCPLNLKRDNSAKPWVACIEPSNYESTQYSKYDSIMLTDEAATSNYMFVDGIRLSASRLLDLQKDFGCSGKSVEHAWEDGGSAVVYGKHDFYYWVKAGCDAKDSGPLQLTR